MLRSSVFVCHHQWCTCMTVCVPKRVWTLPNDVVLLRPIVARVACECLEFDFVDSSICRSLLIPIACHGNFMVYSRLVVRWVIHDSRVHEWSCCELWWSSRWVIHDGRVDEWNMCVAKSVRFLQWWDQCYPMCVVKPIYDLYLQCHTRNALCICMWSLEWIRHRKCLSVWRRRSQDVASALLSR